jgi:chromosome segregation ATPase
VTVGKPQLKAVGDDTKARTAEREQLAKAIANLREAEGRVDAVQQAQETAANNARTARDTLEAAEANVLVAQRASTQHAVSTALGKAGPAPTTVKEARTAVVDAKDDLATAEEALAELDKELKSAESKFTFANLRYEQAILAALKVDPAVLKLEEEKQRLHERLRAIEAAQSIARNPFEPRTGNDVPHHNEAKRLAPEWWDAVVQLRDDADAPLPD